MSEYYRLPFGEPDFEYAEPWENLLWCWEVQPAREQLAELGERRLIFDEIIDDVYITLDANDSTLTELFAMGPVEGRFDGWLTFIQNMVGPTLSRRSWKYIGTGNLPEPFPLDQDEEAFMKHIWAAACRALEDRFWLEPKSPIPPAPEGSSDWLSSVNTYAIPPRPRPPEDSEWPWQDSPVDDVVDIVLPPVVEKAWSLGASGKARFTKVWEDTPELELRVPIYEGSIPPALMATVVNPQLKPVELHLSDDGSALQGSFTWRLGRPESGDLTYLVIVLDRLES